MERQHTENLLRRHKGKLVNIKSVSAANTQGHVVEVTNDYVSLSDPRERGQNSNLCAFQCMESVTLGKAP